MSFHNTVRILAVLTAIGIGFYITCIRQNSFSTVHVEQSDSWMAIPPHQVVDTFFRESKPQQLEYISDTFRDWAIRRLETISFFEVTETEANTLAIPKEKNGQKLYVLRSVSFAGSRPGLHYHEKTSSVWIRAGALSGVDTITIEKHPVVAYLPGDPVFVFLDATVAR